MNELLGDSNLDETKGSGMQHPIGDQGSPQRWIFFILIAGLAAITTLFIISRIFEHSGPELINSPFSVETRLRTVDVGTARFVVPENMIRKSEQRQRAQLKRLELVLLWPKLEGFSREEQVAFNDVSDNSRLVVALLSQPAEPISSSERLYSIYSQHFSGDPIEGPEGLIGFAMDKDSGFSGETIYFTPDANEPFVARCVRPVEETPAFCMRDILLPDGVQLSYRIRLGLLKEWRMLDSQLSERIGSFQR